MPSLVDLQSWRHEHGVDDAPVASSPDPESLKKLVGMLVDAVSAPSQREQPHEIRICNFRSSRLELVEPLIVSLEEVDGQYLATSYDTGQYGHGFSPDQALDHLCSVLEDYYDLLIEDEERLSQRLASHLRYLRAVLRERK